MTVIKAAPRRRYYLIYLHLPPMHLAPCPHLSSMVSGRASPEDTPLPALYPPHSTGRQSRQNLHETSCMSLSCGPSPGDFLTLQLSSSSRPGSTPRTFSPTTAVIPEIAAPTAICSQFLLAISVEPSAPVNIGKLHPGRVFEAVLRLSVNR